MGPIKQLNGVFGGGLSPVGFFLVLSGDRRKMFERMKAGCRTHSASATRSGAIAASCSTISRAREAADGCGAMPHRDARTGSPVHAASRTLYSAA